MIDPPDLAFVGMTGKNERVTRKEGKGGGSVGAAHKVSLNWLQETMTCHSFNCVIIVWVRETHHW